MFTIKRLLITGGFFLCLIWGTIFYLIMTDSSYQLFVPEFPKLSFSESNVQFIDSNQAGPWKQDLFMGSGDGSSFNGKAFLTNSAATPSAILKNSDIVVYFNFFPKDQRRAYGQINWIKSSDQGRKWTKPAPIVIENTPNFTVSPFSPKAFVLPSGKIKLFFLSRQAGENTNKLYAALSDDGARFTFDPSTQMEIENESLISFTLTMLEDKMHLLAYTEQGAQTGTSYHAISYDGKIFTRLADVQIKDSFYGQNALITDGNQLKLIGTSNKGIWSSTSGDGNSWNSPSYMNFQAENPAVLQVGDNFRIFYTAVTSPSNQNDTQN